MKKSIFVFAAVLLAVILISCSESYSPKESLVLPLKLTARTAGNDSAFIAEITETECRITFSGSDALSKTELLITSEGNYATDGGFTRSVPNGIFPPQEMLIRALRLLNECETSGVESEDGIKYTIDETEIMLYYDKTAGVLTGIETEENGRRFKFTVLSFEPYETQSNGPD